MLPPSIVFFCPACGVKLMLPSHLAGVEGPCPACHGTIQAPTAESQQAPAQLAPTAPSQNPLLAAQPSTKPTAGDPAARQPSSRVPPQPHRRSQRLRRGTFPAVFLAALIALIVGIVQFVNRHADAMKPDASRPATGASTVKRILAADEPATSPRSVPLSVSTTASDSPTDVETALVQPSISSLKTLEKFLAADTLADRLPLIETQTSPADLAKSCLAGALAHTTIETTYQASNDAAKIIDCYYRVGFQRAPGKHYLQTMLVRMRGVGPPKVVVDPLFDLYGGRLAAYAATPTDQPGYFHVVLCALSQPPADWPNAENKFTIKLQSDDKADVSVAAVIADRMSGIGKALTDSAITGLRWGQAKPCYVMLQWNMENPTKPYLEALDVKRLDWNP